MNSARRQAAAPSQLSNRLTTDRSKGVAGTSSKDVTRDEIHNTSRSKNATDRFTDRDMAQTAALKEAISRLLRNNDLPDEVAGLSMAQDAIEGIMQKTGNEIVWLELSKFKLPFVAQGVHKLGERVLEQGCVRADSEDRNFVESSEEEEPAPATKDRKVPY